MSQFSTEIRSDQLAPHSIEAEEAVLGSILLNPEAFFEVLPFLKAEDYFLVRHGWIWDAMVSLHERRDPIDHLTLISELEQTGRLSEVGGAAYIISLINKTPSALNVEGYGRIVERMALRRRLIEAAQQVARVAHSDETDIDEVVNRAEQAIFEVTERRLAHDLVPVKDVVSEYFDRVSFMARHQEMVMGVPTGFIDLDRMLGGMQKSDLIIIAARPGMGKSSMLNSIVMNAARLNQRVALFSLEMSNEQLVQRFVSSLTRIPSQKLREGKLDEKDWAEFVKAAEDMSRQPIHMDDTPALGTQELRSKARRLHLELGLDLILVDYLQLMTTPFRSENRVQEISYISRSLKQIARELNVPVVAAAQLSRAVEQRTDKRPMLSDLRESGCLAGDTQIYLPDSGELVPIRELAGRDDIRVLSLNRATWKLETTPVARAFMTGTKPVYRLTTALGRTIRATANHKFLTFDGWKRLDELAVGVALAVPHQLEYEMNLPVHEAWSAVSVQWCNLPAQADHFATDRELAQAFPIAQVVGSEEVALLAESDVYWDPILSIEEDGISDVYDLTVPGLHNFIADNMIVHNSIEQDSDVVMFIYRDAYYDQESPDGNRTEIHIAKHRNGPTGVVDLIFVPELTQFQNAASRSIDLDTL
jgi:replicative DNA helicase